LGSRPAPLSLSLFPFCFVLLFKLVGLVVYQPQLSTHQLALKDYMLSLNYGQLGSRHFGGAGAAYYYYRNRKKEELPKPLR